MHDEVGTDPSSGRSFGHDDFFLARRHLTFAVSKTKDKAEKGNIMSGKPNLTWNASRAWANWAFAVAVLCLTVIGSSCLCIRSQLR
jgi:hypothetical protein